MAKKFIDADVLKEEIEQNWDMQDLYLPIHFFDKVDDMPAADVQEVRHEKWFGTVCSACGESTSFWFDCNYCPNCGARMDGENE